MTQDIEEPIRPGTVAVTLVDGSTEHVDREELLAAAAILNSREATGVDRPIAWRNPWPAQKGGA